MPPNTGAFPTLWRRCVKPNYPSLSRKHVRRSCGNLGFPKARRDGRTWKGIRDIRDAYRRAAIEKYCRLSAAQTREGRQELKRCWFPDDVLERALSQRERKFIKAQYLLALHEQLERVRDDVWTDIYDFLEWSSGLASSLRLMPKKWGHVKQHLARSARRIVQWLTSWR